MGTCMQLFQLGTSIKVLADSFEEYIKKTAKHVKGDEIFSALSTIECHRNDAKKIYKLSETHELKPIEEDQSTK
ncbi:MAG: hypothetical protein GY797_38935 [Deltaproteobacteria bacterium]|nr:hypothetical protein [Deltaproteobacteria bacterium]